MCPSPFNIHHIFIKFILNNPQGMNHNRIQICSSATVFAKERITSTKLLQVKPLKPKTGQEVKQRQSTRNDSRADTKESKNNESQYPDWYVACADPIPMPSLKPNLKRKFHPDESSSSSCTGNCKSSTNLKY